MREKFKNPTVRIMASIFGGIVIGVLICFVAISIGYNQMNDTSLINYNVKVFGLSIFNIHRIGSELVGTPNNSSMMFIGVIFSMILAIFIEIFIAFKNNIGKNDTF
ncbi:LlsX family protein [Listeria seeligeri]|uniref:LlsX family protein n=1 Tax=Listeria seeligeri TaxID=1640 RepID=UPI00162A981B|nr:LlsX family protein [Listeria seeligeri]MBC2017536.1 LlsX family protein [Listeria seeligeri]